MKKNKTRLKKIINNGLIALPFILMILLQFYDNFTIEDFIRDRRYDQRLNARVYNSIDTHEVTIINDSGFTSSEKSSTENGIWVINKTIEGNYIKIIADKVFINDLYYGKIEKHDSILIDNKSVMIGNQKRKVIQESY